MKYFVAVYDENDLPVITFENYIEAAKFFNTTRHVIACNICRHQIKKFDGKHYRLHKIYCDENIEISKKNIRIDRIINYLKIMEEIKKGL